MMVTFTQNKSTKRVECPDEDKLDKNGLQLLPMDYVQPYHDLLTERTFYIHLGTTLWQ